MLLCLSSISHRAHPSQYMPHIKAQHQSMTSRETFSQVSPPTDDTSVAWYTSISEVPLLPKIENSLPAFRTFRRLIAWSCLFSRHRCPLRSHAGTYASGCNCAPIEASSPCQESKDLLACNLCTVGKAAKFAWIPLPWRHCKDVTWLLLRENLTRCWNKIVGNIPVFSKSREPNFSSSPHLALQL